MRLAGSFLAILSVIYLVIRGDILLRFRTRLSHDGLLAWVSHAQVRIASRIFILCSWFTHFRLSRERFEGGRLPKSFLLVSNHQSLLDIAALMYAFPRHDLRFVTKRELAVGIPYVSLALHVGGHALISRTGDFRRGRRALQKLADSSADGVCPVVFPEGTRSRTGDLRVFQSGAFRIILERAPLPVLSVAVDGGYRVAKILQVLQNLDRTYYRVKPLTLHPAPKGKREILDLLSRIEGEIGAQLARWKNWK